jgi:hypothetical protein
LIDSRFSLASVLEQDDNDGSSLLISQLMLLDVVEFDHFSHTKKTIVSGAWYAVTLKTSNVKNKLLLFVTGLVVLAAGSAVGYWHHSQREWCVQFTPGGGQEVTYSRGCLNRQRYKKWTLTASRIHI